MSSGSFAAHYALLRAGQWPSIDKDAAFDSHVLACILAAGLADAEEEGLAPTEAVGLPPDVLATLLHRRFPLICRDLLELMEGPSPMLTDEEEMLRDLLMSHRAATGPVAGWLASMVARRAMRPDHLWQDLGLVERSELGRLLARHFPRLHAGNTNNMRWKKYFYRVLCEAEGFSLCTAPSCKECSDFSSCFGMEDGVSRMAQLRAVTEKAA